MATFHRVAAVADVPEGGSLCVTVDGQRVALFKLAGDIYAIDDCCSHAEASLSAGAVQGDEVICPRHGARFSIKTGAALSLPAIAPVETFPVKVEGDDVLVSVD